MATTTPNLRLSKPEVADKLVDSLYDFNGNADLLDAIIGKLSDLNTAQKDSLVAAINEALTSAGTAAGFGNPVATVDGNTGTPSVEVTASGPDTAKVFTFTFRNLKGDKGATGPQGPKGDTGAQGDTGPQGPQGPKGDKGDPGAKGDSGSAGSDGISPVVSVETISGGHRITITDAEGSQSFDVLDGASGSGSGDMTKAVYDPKGKAQDVFAYADTKYSKPSGGIPKKDLASDVQTSLGKADSALQSYTETDPTVPEWAKAKTKPTYTASEVGALPANTRIPSTVAEMSDSGDYAKKSDLTNKVSKSGDTMTGKLTVPQVETGTGNSNFFQCRKFRGEGNADTYYHAIDFGYQNHDRVDFHEYGGLWSFYKNQTGKVNDGVLCGKITSNGWEGRAKLESGSTMVTSQLTENSNAIATTAFVHGLVDGLKPKRVSVTLPASGWNSSAKTQTVSVAGVTASSNGSLRIAQSATDAQFTAWGAAQPRVTAQANGSITVKLAGTVPTIDIPVEVLFV